MGITGLLILSIMPISDAFAITEDFELTASDGAAGDQFGTSVSISGDKAIVGAFRDDSPVTDSGSASIFEFNGTNWVETKITASDSVADHFFGGAVSLSQVTRQ